MRINFFGNICEREDIIQTNVHQREEIFASSSAADATQEAA